MTPTIKTAVYAAIAVILAGAAWLTDRAMQPPDLSGFNLVGQEFYPDFNDPAKAARLRVAAYDTLSEEPQVFTVEKHGDQWRIPSHHDYPAEAKQRLAETAASVIGIEREALAARRKADHRRYGVIDPLDEEADSPRGRGQRITLYDEAGEELVDLIIGNEVEDRQGRFYVRRYGENQVYIAALDIQLSTKFSKWIEPDLLKLSSSDVVLLERRKPIYQERMLGPIVAQQLVGEDVVRLSREDGFADWKLEGLDEQTEELDDGPARDAASALDNLEIVDVRPKPPGLRPDLSLDTDYIRVQAQLENLYRDLSGKGFELELDPDTLEGKLSSEQGELFAATDEGVVYRLHFGSRVAGAGQEIEVGGASSGDGDAGTDDETTDDETTATDSSGNGEEAGRYVFVLVEFDAKHVGTPPVPPEKPEMPPELKEQEGGDSGDGSTTESDAETSDSDEDDAENADAPDASAADTGNAEQPDSVDADSNDGQDEPEDPKKKLREEYEAALRDYELDKADYEREKEEYDEKIEEGKKKADFLNNRFKDWYYVISGENYDDLRLSREKLVKPKETDDGSQPDTGEATPPFSGESEQPVEAPVPVGATGPAGSAVSKDGSAAPKPGAE